MKRDLGFTLIEVLIAVSILAILSLLTGQSIQNAIRDKNRIQKNIDHSSSLRSAFKVIERDIQMAFNFKDLNQQVVEKLKAEEEKRKNQGQSDNRPPPPGFAPQAQEPLTQFLGDREQIHFTSLNHVRMFADARESDQQEVGYYVAQCRKLGQPDKTTRCLWRRTTPYLDERVDEGGSARVLLEDVSNLEFRFYSIEKEDWVETWRSGEGGDAITRNKFPDAVEVTLETEKNDRKLMLSSIVPIRHPNNRELKDKITPPGPPSGSQSGGNN